MAEKKKRRRLKRKYKISLASIMGLISGIILAYNVNAEAPLTNIVVQPGTIAIEDYAYFKNSEVIQVILPDGLQQIGFSSFEGDKSLKQINLPDSISVIDNRAFAKCTSLTEMKVPDNAVFIGNAAFYGCESLKKVTLPSDLTGIENNMFYGCTSLSSIEIPDGVKTIGQQSFYNCTSLTALKLPDTLTTIEDGAFYDCTGLALLEVPDSVTEIGMDAFEGCNNLKLVYSPDSYMAQYAKENGLELTNNKDYINNSYKTNPDNPDVPATDVNTPYLLVLIILAMSLTGMIIMKLFILDERSDYGIIANGLILNQYEITRISHCKRD